MKWSYQLITILIAFSSFLSSCENSNSKKPVNSSIIYGDTISRLQLERNKALVLKLYQALNDTNWAAARALVAPDFKHHYVKDTGFGEIAWNDFESAYRQSLKGFPDWRLKPVKVIAEEDLVSVLLSGQGSHRGEFAGIPATNIKAATPIMLLHQIKQGKIIADWEVMNQGSFLEQLKKK